MFSDGIAILRSNLNINVLNNVKCRSHNVEVIEIRVNNTKPRNKILLVYTEDRIVLIAITLGMIFLDLITKE